MMKKSMICLALFIITCKVSFSQSDCDVCENFKNNVVKITTTFSDGSDENGFGTIIGENGDQLLVLTAKHVIYKLDNIGIKTQQVNINFYTDQGTNYRGTLLSLSNNRFDITLVEVAKPQNFTWTKDFYSNSIQRGTQVWFIGRAGDWYVPTGPYVGSINHVSLDDEISIDINSVLPGTSGGPLISKDGLVGMIFKDASTGAKAYSMDKIKQIMSTWNYHCLMNLNPNSSANTETTNANSSENAGAIRKAIDFRFQVSDSKPLNSCDLYVDDVFIKTLYFLDNGVGADENKIQLTVGKEHKLNFKHIQPAYQDVSEDILDPTYLTPSRNITIVLSWELLKPPGYTWTPRILKGY